MTPRLALLAAGLFGASAVLLGAAGAHALREFLLARGMQATWETAVQFHLMHAVALVGLAGWWQGQGGWVAGRRAAWAARCWSVGIVFFSGSLYLLAAGGPHWLGPITPLGGIALIAGWGWIIAAAFAPAKE
jgi:uncharacterized membrane protein YgdD (TMEM256/DUF423 family)